MKYNDLPGVINCENKTVDEIMTHVKVMEAEMGINPNDYFDELCPLYEFVNCSADFAFEYASQTESLEEWTMSLRNFSHVCSDLYLSDDILEENTKIYTRTKSHKDTGCIDYLCAWDQSKELWMRYYFRILDANDVLGRKGCVIVWFNCKHKYYDRNNQEIPEYIMEQVNRSDRNWVGDLWPMFYFGHKIELTNLKLILEEKYRTFDLYQNI